jgi:very-short-patch-repair endonuclease
MPRWQDIPKVNFQRAREMRREPTAAEKKLWQHIHAGKLGTRVRRQMIIGPYIADFVLTDHKIILEVDGPTYGDDDRIEYDAARTEWLEQKGYRVIRIGNLAILQNISGVLERIELAIAETPPNPPAKARGNQNLADTR